jgi:hypothetical protein
MPESFELPDDLSALDDEQLADALAGAVQAFDAKAKSSLVTPTDIEDLRALAGGVEAMRKEQQERIDAAKQAAAEIEQLAAQVRGEDAAPAAPELEEPSVQKTVADQPETVPAPEKVTASSNLVKRPALNLASVRAPQPRVLPEPPAPGTHITAAVDVPGYTPGAPLDFGQVVTGIISRANALKTAGGGRARSSPTGTRSDANLPHIHERSVAVSRATRTNRTVSNKPFTCGSLHRCPPAGQLTDVVSICINRITGSRKPEESWEIQGDFCGTARGARALALAVLRD